MIIYVIFFSILLGILVLIGASQTNVPKDMKETKTMSVILPLTKQSGVIYFIVKGDIEATRGISTIFTVSLMIPLILIRGYAKEQKDGKEEC